MTPSIRMLRIDRALADALAVGDEAFEPAFGGRLAEAAPFARQNVVSSLEFFSRQNPPWGGYLVVDDASGQLVGSCGFKGEPTDAGAIEIAYYTFPPFEGSGYATAMAAHLLALAESSPLVHRVIAHTLPEANASTRVLTKIGMRFAGEVWDPEDGRVWQWEHQDALAPASD
jgi:RimJ/RimL family protein N-acetyltransferase